MENDRIPEHIRQKANDLIPHIGALRQRLARKFLIRFVKPRLERRANIAGEVYVDGLKIATRPTVLHPTIFRTGVMLGRAIGDLTPHPNHKTMLDMGCGSGIVGLFAARRGFDVTAVDINPDATELTKLNASLNGLNDQIRIFQGDLFEPVANKKFDVIAFSPPYFKGKPKNNKLSLAFWSDTIAKRFAEGLKHHLAPNGKAYLHLSTDGDSVEFLGRALMNGLDIKTYQNKSYMNEIMTIYVITLADR